MFAEHTPVSLLSLMCISVVARKVEVIAVKGKSKTQLFILFFRGFCLFTFLVFTSQFVGKTAMKNHLKLAINFLASLVVMVSGTMQSALAEEIWLDFSVPQADVRVTAPIVASNREAAPTASSSQPRLKQQAPQTTLSTESSVVSGASQSDPSLIAIASNADVIAQKHSEKASQNAAKLIALDFSVPNADSSPAPVAAGFSGSTQPSHFEPTPPPVKAKVRSRPLPVSKAPRTSAIKTPTVKPLSGKTRSKQVTALRRAIIGQESAGKFWLINPDSGALGYGQLLRANVAPWTKAALGRALTPQEFLASPELQIKTIDHKLNQYLQRELIYTGGNNEEVAIRRVASAWYSGNPKLWNNTSPQYSNGRRYPSIKSYTGSVWRRYLREIG